VVTCKHDLPAAQCALCSGLVRRNPGERASTEHERWSAKDSERFVELWKAGTPVKEMAGIFGRTERAIANRAWYLRGQPGHDELRRPDARGDAR
jgi:hypothetical protein